MIAYSIYYKVSGKSYQQLVDAKNINSAKKKLGKKHGYKDGRKISITAVSVVGYF